MKKAIYVYFVFSLFLGTTVYFAQKLKLSLPKIINFYLNDFLIIPILLISCLIFLRWSRQNKNYQIPVWIVLYICGLYALLFEYILPKFHPRYTADIIDAVLYFIGGFVFMVLQKKE